MFVFLNFFVLSKTIAYVCANQNMLPISNGWFLTCLGYKFPYKKFDNLWARGYYCGSAGHVSQEQVKRYAQKSEIFARKNASHFLCKKNKVFLCILKIFDFYDIQEQEGKDVFEYDIHGCPQHLKGQLKIGDFTKL